MTINVTGRGTNVQDSFHKLLESKLSKFDRFFDEDTVAKVTVTNEGGRETVEVTINAGGTVIRSERTTKDRQDSLDSVVDSLFSQIVRNKGKLQNRLRKPAFEPDFESNLPEIEGFDDSNEDDYKIVRSKQFALKPMDAEEGILQMNLLGHNFYMFLNSETEEVCVVYKRNDGNYGLIEPRPE